jgi:hypothetical protein
MRHENVIGGAEQYFHFGNDIFQDRVKLGSPMMNHRLTAGGQDPGGYIHRSGGKQHRCTEFLHEFASINWWIAARLAVLIAGHSVDNFYISRYKITTQLSPLADSPCSQPLWSQNP